MSIQKHEIPILEFDSDPSAVLDPGHEVLDVHFPEYANFPRKIKALQPPVVKLTSSLSSLQPDFLLVWET